MLGLAAGVLLLKLDIVDCERWDIFAVMQGRKGMSRSEAEAKRKRSGPSPSASAPKVHKPAKPSGASAPEADPADLATRKLRRSLDEGEVMSARAAYDKAMRTVAGWQPSGPDWLELIKALLEAKEWRTAISVMEDYLRRAEEPSPRVRLELAQLLIREQQRPAHALRVLAEVPARSLPDSLEKTRRQLVLQAEQMREEGVLELEGEAW